MRQHYLKIQPEQCTMIFDNEPRNEQIVNRMLKAVDKKIMITDIMLDYKDGGRSGKFVRD